MSGTLLTAVQFVGGFVLLVWGAEVLVRGASQIATKLGISPLIVGLTVVAFGTSAPELAVSVQSALTGSPDLAIGNVVGSNICNILLILGIAAVITPLAVDRQLIKLDVPLMVGMSVLLFLLCLDGSISRIDGVILITCLAIYLFVLLRVSKNESGAIKLEYAEGVSENEGKTKPLWWNLGAVTIGMLGLVGGSKLLVMAAITVATALGISELVIGLTVIALGTSLPEVATSVIAAVKGETDIAAGNAVGSNLFNIMSVLGITALVAPDGISVAAQALHFDIPVMIMVAAMCLPVFFVGSQINRVEGMIFLAYYLAYTCYLILVSAEHSLVQPYVSVVLWLFLPLSVIVWWVYNRKYYAVDRVKN